MTILVPFNKLVPSKANVRRVKTDLAPLVASLRADGILQNLVVVPVDNDRYEVVAGERRRRAAGVLVKEGTWRKDQPIPCEARAAEEAVALSIAENVERVAMHPADAFRAFAALTAQGHDETATAMRRARCASCCASRRSAPRRSRRSPPIGSTSPMRRR